MSQITSTNARGASFLQPFLLHYETSADKNARRDRKNQTLYVISRHASVRHNPTAQPRAPIPSSSARRHCRVHSH
jgi:hypothetical protein